MSVCGGWVGDKRETVAGIDLIRIELLITKAI